MAVRDSRRELTAPVRLALFAAVLLLAGGTAYAGGRATGPVLPAPGPAHSSDAGAHGAQHGSVDRADGVTGLAVADDGLALRLERDVLEAGRQELRFTVKQPDGTPLTAYDTTHDRDLHLVVVRRDLTRFQHLHPVRDGAGRWSVELVLDAAGPYRVIADFAPAGRPARALATDVVVPGAYVPAPRPTGEVRTSAGGAYRVDLSGLLTAGRPSELSFEVTRSGRDVTPELDPHLGARGHLVVLREGDLAYLHVHPDDDRLSFTTSVPSRGRYAAFLDTSHAGRVRTAVFALEAR